MENMERINRLTEKNKYDIYCPKNKVSILDLSDKLGKLEDLLEKYNINSIEKLESIVFMFNIIDKKAFLPLLVESMQSLYTEESEYFMTEEEYKVFKEYYPKRMIRKNYGDIDEKLSVFDKEWKDEA